MMNKTQYTETQLKYMAATYNWAIAKNVISADGMITRENLRAFANTTDKNWYPNFVIKNQSLIIRVKGSANLFKLPVDLFKQYLKPVKAKAVKPAKVKTAKAVKPAKVKTANEVLATA